MTPLRRGTCALLLSVLATACGSDGPASPTNGSFPLVSAPATLAPDGSVPFVDEPAGLHEYDTTPPPEPDPGDAKPCRADQLTAVLPRWYSQGAGNEPGRRPAPGLYGFARVSAKDRCTLSGEAELQLRIAGSPAPVQYANSVTEESKRRVTLVDGSHEAELRVDWSPPYCGPTGPQQLVVTLPHDGGTITVPVTEPKTPPCSGAANEGTQLRTYVSGGVFTRYLPPTRDDSPLGALRATLTAAPRSTRAGEVVRFRVRLTNPTAQPVPLQPCPGFYLERFVLGTGNRTGFNTGQVYRLNCRPISAIPARGSVVFQMEATVPDDPPGGPTFSITWRLLAPHLTGADTVAINLPMTS